jgi:uroporphyrinogen-III synthase
MPFCGNAPEGEVVSAAGRGGTLAGVTVLVTRPAAQSETLSRLIRAAGGRAHALPALDIGAPRDPQRARAVIDRAGEYELVIFVSINAVDAALRFAAESGAKLPVGRLYAAGPGTAARLAAAGLGEAEYPTRDYGANGLLELPALGAGRVRGRRVLICRGEGGREHLARGLTERGALVESVALYRRVRPVLARRDIAALDAASIDVLVATSGEALENLAAMLTEADRAELMARPLVVGAARLEALARARGFGAIAAVAASPRDRDIVAALERWAADR